MEKNLVRTFNKDYKMLYENEHKTAESAYEEYVSSINLLKRTLSRGEVVHVARFRYGQLMTIETVTGIK